MEQLELKHLSPYLPYGLKVSKYHTLHCGDGAGSVEHILTTENLYFKPILRPLSELNVESIESTLFGKMSDNIAEWFKYFDSDSQNKDIAILQAPYPVLEYCFENHFDVFSLIKNGLAIDINTL